MDLQRICALAGWEESRLLYLDETQSTNDIAKKIAREGAAHGTAVLASRQTAGRGRLGRSFLSPEGGIYLSLILRPQFTAEELLPLTALLAAAAADAVAEVAGIRPQTKWVNDLVLDHKKLAGILTEPAFSHNGSLDFVVCGIGLNCNTDPDSFAPEVQALATSLKAVTGKAQDTQALVASLLRHLPRVCLPEEKQTLMDAYRKHSATLGQPVKVLAETLYTGLAEEIDDSGALLVRDEGGNLRRIQTGEVSVRGLYGYV